MKHLLILSILAFICSCTNNSSKKPNVHNKSNKEKIYIYDKRYFDNSPVEKIAHSIYEEDSISLRKELKTKKYNVNFKHEKSGITLLSWAVFNKKKNAVKILLENKADPNIADLQGRSSIFFIFDDINQDTTILKLLIDNGANVNHVATPLKTDALTPLIEASLICFSCVKILVENGADINFYRKNYTYPNAVSAAAIMEETEILYYLIVEKDADISKPIVFYNNGEVEYIETSLDSLASYFKKLDEAKYQEEIKTISKIKEYIKSK